MSTDDVALCLRTVLIEFSSRGEIRRLINAIYFVDIQNRQEWTGASKATPFGSISLSRQLRRFASLLAIADCSHQQDPAEIKAV